MHALPTVGVSLVFDYTIFIFTFIQKTYACEKRLLPPGISETHAANMSETENIAQHNKYVFLYAFFPLTTIAIYQYAISTLHHFIYSHYNALQDVANDQNL